MKRISPWLLLGAFAAIAGLLGGCTKNHSTAPDQINGSGRIVSQQLSMASFSGIQVTRTGSIVYLGNPQIVNKTVTGIGSIRPGL